MLIGGPRRDMELSEVSERRQNSLCAAADASSQASAEGQGQAVLRVHRGKVRPSRPV